MCPECLQSILRPGKPISRGPWENPGEAGCALTRQMGREVTVSQFFTQPAAAWRGRSQCLHGRARALLCTLFIKWEGVLLIKVCLRSLTTIHVFLNAALLSSLQTLTAELSGREHRKKQPRSQTPTTTTTKEARNSEAQGDERPPAAGQLPWHHTTPSWYGTKSTPPGRLVSITRGASSWRHWKEGRREGRREREWMPPWHNSLCSTCGRCRVLSRSLRDCSRGRSEEPAILFPQTDYRKSTMYYISHTHGLLSFMDNRANWFIFCTVLFCICYFILFVVMVPKNK